MDAVKPIDCGYVEDHDLVKSYLGGTLSEEEAEAFEAHYFECDRCWEEVNIANQIRAATAAAPPIRIPSKPRRTLRSAWPALAIAAAVAIVAFSAGLLVSRSRRVVGVERIASATPELPYSRLQARLAGPFEALPPDRAVRGDEPSGTVDLKAAALQAQQEARDRPSATSLHAAGVGHLLLGEQEEAVQRLEEARKRSPEVAAIWTDLSAAYLARARALLARHEEDAAVRDFDAALRTLQSAPDASTPSKAALFNRALVLEARNLKEEAIEAWQKYKVLESDAQWREEADRHLARLTRPTVSEMWLQERGILGWKTPIRNERIVRETIKRFPQQSRYLAQNQVLPAWGEAFLDGKRSEAGFALDLARLIAKVRAEASGDFLLEDSVAAIDEATRRGERSRLENLARGHVEYAAGRKAEASLETSEAFRQFVQARDHLAQGGSPFEGHAKLGIGALGIYRGIRETLEIAEEVIATGSVAGNRQLSILAHAHWHHGYALTQLGYPNEAIEAERRALILFERLGETENAAFQHGLISENLGYLGDLNNSWVHLDRALELLNDVGKVSQRTLWMAAAARAYTDEGRTALALAAYDRLLAEAKETGKPDLIADALLSSARARALAGRGAQAASDVEEARRVLASIPEGDARDRLESNLYLSEIKLLGSTSDSERLQSLTNALDTFERTENQFKQAQVLLERGRLLAGRGENDEARADFDRAILKLEDERDHLPAGEARILYFDTGRLVFDSMIELLAAKGDVAGSFRYAEQAHARALLDGFEDRHGDRASQPLQADQVVSRLPEKTALIEYYVCPDALVVWVLTDAGVRMARTPLSGTSLEELATRIEEAATDPKRSPDAESALSELHALLMKPIEAAIATMTHLVIVPDRELHRVPFSALRSPSGRYVVEDHDVTITPSATWFARKTESAQNREEGPPSVLLVAGPGSPTGIAGPPLPRLEGAEEEVEQLARLYPGATLLTGDRATKKNFLELAPRSSIIHFAGHAIANRVKPGLSLLVLASGRAGQDADTLYSHEISGALERTRLVVLGACSTAAGRTSATEGMVGLARAFLSSGVPVVVASLWRVNDQTTAAFLADIHRGLERGATVAASLRAAQLTLLQGRLAPAIWRGFQVYGEPNVVTRRRSV